MKSFAKNTFLLNSIIITLLAIFTSCENDIAVVNSITSATEKQLPIQSTKNVEYIYSDSAVVRAKLTSPQMDNYEGKKKYTEFPKGMEVVFYDQHNKVQTKLTANYGISYDNGNNGMDRMDAKGNVIVINNEKACKLNTEHLIWNAITKKIYTDEFVRITTKNEVIWGDGLEAKQDFSEWEIKNPKGQIPIKDTDFNNPKK